MTKPENCRFCIDGIVLDSQLSNAMNGKIYGVSRDTIRRHRKHGEGSVKDPFGGIPEEQVTFRRKSVRLPDGSWEIVNFKPNTLPLMQLRDSLEEDLAEVLASPWERDPAPSRPVLPLLVIAVADLQIGKVDINGGTKNTLKRVRKSIDRIISDIGESHYKEILLPEVGDIIENFMNTSSQAQTNDKNLTSQIRIARRIMAEIVRALAPYTDRLTYISVPSNHCTVRVAPKSPASTPSDDFGLEISHQLEEIFTGRAEYERVKFIRPENDFAEEVVYYSKAGNTTFLIAHGHQRNSAFKLGEYVSDLAAFTHSPHHKVQIAIFGHYHNRIQYEWHGREIHICPASDNGSAWYSGRNGQWSRSGILVFHAVDGFSYSPNIF